MSESQTVWINGVLLVVLLLVLYFFFLRPDRKERQQKKLVQQMLKAGDQVTTRLGIHGTVISVNGDLVLLETGRNHVELEVLRSAIVAKDSTDDKGKKRTKSIPINRD